MPNIFNEDFRDFIHALNKYQVEYLLVGGYAVILNGYRRTTGDMDIWVKVTRENHQKLTNAYLSFGLPTMDISEENFLNNNEIEVFTYGIPPVSIDVMKVVKGCNFDEAYELSNIYNEDGLLIRFIHINTLIQAKKASGRFFSKLLVINTTTCALVSGLLIFLFISSVIKNSKCSISFSRSLGKSLGALSISSINTTELRGLFCSSLKSASSARSFK